MSQRELQDAGAAFMDAVELGEAFRIRRHGTVVAELRPASRGAFAGLQGAVEIVVV